MADQGTRSEPAGPVDLAFLRGWIGREQQATDILTPRIADSLRATLEIGESGRTAIPASVHWCLAPPIVNRSGLGADGHPDRGDFLPPVPFPRRMWAGSDVEFFDDLDLMDTVTRRSRIENVEEKQGRTGSLIFVTVEHSWSTVRGAALREIQTIVYRPANATPGIRQPQDPEDEPPPSHRVELQAGEALLFRYSALTFNAHRIHYDRRYAVDVEGYAGLLVHGPLQASLLLAFATQLRGGQRPRRFSFKGLKPLLDGQIVTLNATESGKDLWCADAKGAVTMRAVAEWI